jgi:hypothetical protein
MTEYSTQVPVARRAFFAGAAALAVGGSLPAAAAPADDADLLALYDTWQDLEREAMHAEMLVRQLYDQMPQDLLDIPRVRAFGRPFYDLADLDEAIERAPTQMETLYGHGDPQKKVAAAMLEKFMPEAKAARAELAAMFKRRNEWDAAVGLRAAQEQREDIAAEAADLMEKALLIAPTTQAGFLAHVDMLISLIGGRFDPENNYDHGQFMALGSSDILITSATA